jgi:hypothetical protein
MRRDIYGLDENDENEIRGGSKIRGRKWKMERCAKGPRPAGPRL